MKTASTRDRIVGIAMRLFAADGYEATSIEHILVECAISRGALYHHFASKDALFEAVLEEVESELAKAVVQSVRNASDPVAMLKIGTRTFLSSTRTQRVRQIVLIDAPAVLGWQKWREIDARHGFGLMKAGLQMAASLGRGRPLLIEAFSHVLLAAQMEVALMISRSEDPTTTLETGLVILDAIIDRALEPA